MLYKATTPYRTECVSLDPSSAVHSAARAARDKGDGSLLVTVTLTKLRRVVPVEFIAEEVHRKLAWLDMIDDATMSALQADAPSLAAALTSTITEWLSARGIQSGYVDGESVTVRVHVSECSTVTPMDYGSTPWARALSASN